MSDYTFPEFNHRQKEAMDLIRAAEPETVTILGYGGAVGGGKASSNDALVYTPFGPKRMGDIRVGDVVCSSDGGATKVLGVYPQGEQDLYRVTFTDGASTLVTADHLWNTWQAQRKRKNGQKCRVLTTKMIADHIERQGRNKHKYNLIIPLADPVQFTIPKGRGNKYPIEPYLLGLLIGDGCLGKAMSMTTADTEIAAYLQGVFGKDLAYRGGYDYRIQGESRINLVDQLKALGLFNHRSWEKFIPNDYKYMGVDDRWALIQGLMDTDGTADSRGHISFASTSQQLALDVQWLARSLGAKATLTERLPSFVHMGETREGRLAYNVTINHKTPSMFFRLSRKRSRCVDAFNGGESDLGRRIVSVDFEKRGEATCIAVDHPNSLYLTDDFIVTHNTHFIVRAVISIALAYPGSRILVGRNELNRLRTTTMEEFDRICPPDMVVKKNENDNYRHLRMAHWPEGVVSQVFFRGLDNWQNLGSEQYSAIFIDEASDTSKMVPLMLITRLRHQLPRKVQDAFRAREPQWGMRYFFIAASNPYPGWFTDWFLLKKLDEPLEAGGGRAKIHFIPSKISDNAHNLPPGYEATARAALQAYSPEMAQRFIDGRFDVYPDQVYGEVFEPRIHKWMAPAPEKKDYARVVGGLDFGGAKSDAHFTAGIVAVITNSNRLIRVAEFKDRGPGVLDRQIAWMLAQQAKWCSPGKKIHWCADRTQGVGINAYQRMGFFITPSIGRPIDQGIVDVARRLAKDSTGLPGSFYLPELIEFENEMQLYRWERDENDNRAPKNKPIKRNDDLCLVPETQVWTPYGELPIADLRSGDSVIAADGSVVPVLWGGVTGRNVETITVEFSDGTSITGTPDHQIVSLDGVVSLDSLRYGDIVPGYSDRYTDEYGKRDLQRVEWSALSALSGFAQAQPSSVLAEAHPSRNSVLAHRHLGGGQWAGPEGDGHSPYRLRSIEQLAREPYGDFATRTRIASPRQSDRGAGSCSCRPYGCGSSTYEEVAFFQRGARVAPQSCCGIHSQDSNSERFMYSLWDTVSDRYRSGGETKKVLLEQLQVSLTPGAGQGLGAGDLCGLWAQPNGESLPGWREMPRLRTVVRRSFESRKEVYDISIGHPSHLFWANGSLVHNCDCDRYMHEIVEKYIGKPEDLLKFLPDVR